MVKIKHRAQFPNGGELTRTTSSGRIYSHAWLVRDLDTNEIVTSGFSGSHHLANKASECAASGWERRRVNSEVVETTLVETASNARRLPWRIKRIDLQRPSFVSRGNAHLRFRTQAEANRQIRLLKLVQHNADHVYVSTDEKGDARRREP